MRAPAAACLPASPLLHWLPVALPFLLACPPACLRTPSACLPPRFDPNYADDMEEDEEEAEAMEEDEE